MKRMIYGIMAVVVLALGACTPSGRSVGSNECVSGQQDTVEQVAVKF